MKNDIHLSTFSFYYDVIINMNEHYLIVYSHKSYKYELIECNSTFYVRDNILYINELTPSLLSKVEKMLQKKLIYPLRNVKRTWTLNNINEIDGIQNSRNLFYKEKPHLFLFEITFILNYIFPNALPEYHYPHHNDPHFEKNVNIDFDYVKLCTNKYYFPNLNKVSILGDNIFHTPIFYQVLEHCQSLNIETHIYLKYCEYVKNIDTINKCNINININIYCDDLYDYHLNNHIAYKNFYNKYHKYYYPIQNISKYCSTTSLLNRYKFPVQFFPSLKLERSVVGKLLTFEKSKVLNRQFNRNDLFRNYLTNDYFFGKLIVDNSGNIWPSFLHNILGCLQNQRIDDLIHKAFADHSAWMLSRSIFHLCKNCAYNIFCPSISPYEIIYNQTFCK